MSDELIVRAWKDPQLRAQLDAAKLPANPAGSASVIAAGLPALLDEIAERPGVDCAFVDAAPGPMTGLAGVGLGLLTFARPGDTPLVLGLEAPPGAGP
jgi:mersacidin/lichenicidin family type 2 lantibiotic